MISIEMAKRKERKRENLNVIKAEKKKKKITEQRGETPVCIIHPI